MATAQRSYSAACPGCGAPALFTSLASTHAVCRYCRSTVVRDGDALKRLGTAAEIFEDYSPLQLMAQGRWNTQTFTLIGRLQFQGEYGRWTEWVADLGVGRTAILSEDNGGFVFAQRAASVQGLPNAAAWKLGLERNLNGEVYTVTSVSQTQWVSAQGELPKLPAADARFTVVELRSPLGAVLTIDYGSKPAQVYQGRAVTLDDLALSGLKMQSEQTLLGRQFSCPSCGFSVGVQLENTKSLTCSACKCLIDLSAGLGGELRYAAQREPVQPQIPLGSEGTFLGKKWQIVGYQHCMGTAGGLDDEHFGWEEYLLYNRQAGFQFLVDSTDGWSLVRPTTGAAKVSGSTATYLNAQYDIQGSYTSETGYVAGEFYWPVKQGQKTSHMDFASGRNLLNREQSGQEINWSLGHRLDGDTVVQAFNLPLTQLQLFQRDVKPLGFSINRIALWAALICLILLVLAIVFWSSSNKQCAAYDAASGLSPEQYQQQCQRSGGGRGGYGSSSGGSYGGYSSGGGGHK